MSEFEEINELQWAHGTLIRLIRSVQRNGLLDDKLRHCIVKMTESSVLLEGLIQAQLVNARRRSSDALDAS